MAHIHYPIMIQGLTLRLTVCYLICVNFLIFAFTSRIFWRCPKYVCWLKISNHISFRWVNLDMGFHLHAYMNDSCSNYEVDVILLCIAWVNIYTYFSHTFVFYRLLVAYVQSGCILTNIYSDGTYYQPGVVSSDTW